MEDRNGAGGGKIAVVGSFDYFARMKPTGEKKKLVILTGAGISAESGLRTFRDSDGLWEGYQVTEVATPRAWRKDPALVLEFYNMRRRDVAKAEPNARHLGLT